MHRPGLLALDLLELLLHLRLLLLRDGLRHPDRLPLQPLGLELRPLRFVLPRHGGRWLRR